MQYIQAEHVKSRTPIHHVKSQNLRVSKASPRSMRMLDLVISSTMAQFLQGNPRIIKERESQLPLNDFLRSGGNQRGIFDIPMNDIGIGFRKQIELSDQLLGLSGRKIGRRKTRIIEDSSRRGRRRKNQNG